MSSPTAAIITFGCRLNQADSGWLAESLRQAGFTLVPAKQKADLVIINSCTVTKEAARKTRQAARSARRRCPQAFIVVSGCDPQVDSEKWTDEPAADLVLDNSQKQQLLDYLPAWIKPALFESGRGVTGRPEMAGTGEKVGYYPDRTRANLKVQEGCDFFCSYCIVPYARGAPRSRSPAEIVREAELLLKRGHRELVVTGVNLACYQYDGMNLIDLLGKLLSIGNEFRLRLSSVEPVPLVRRLIPFMAENQDRICRFLHLPLQYGDNKILRAMNRSYTVDDYRETTELAAKLIPRLHLGADIIVGFPGETETDFATCLATVRSLALANLHVFRYSPRPGTSAAGFPGKVGKNTVTERYKELTGLAGEMKRAFASHCLGAELPVLIEKTRRNGAGSGWSDNYLRVRIKKLPAASQGHIVRAMIMNITEDNQLEGELV